MLGALTSFCAEKPPSARGGTAGLGHSVAQASIDAVLAFHFGFPEQERRASVARLRAALDALAAAASSDDRDPYVVLLVPPARALIDALEVIDQRTETRIAVVTKLERVLGASDRAGAREEAAKRQ